MVDLAMDVQNVTAQDKIPFEVPSLAILWIVTYGSLFSHSPSISRYVGSIPETAENVPMIRPPSFINLLAHSKILLSSPRSFVVVGRIIFMATMIMQPQDSFVLALFWQ